MHIEVFNNADVMLKKSDPKADADGHVRFFASDVDNQCVRVSKEVVEFILLEFPKIKVVNFY